MALLYNEGHAMSYIEYEMKTPRPIWGVIVGIESDAGSDVWVPDRYRLTIEFSYDADYMDFLAYLKHIPKIAKRGDGRLHGSGLPWVILSAPEKKEPRQ